MLCPYDLTICTNEECADGFCRISAENVLWICESCGLPGEGYVQFLICFSCVVSSAQASGFEDLGHG